jgi:phospholipid/cholesterol/gamma-HCH transport system permease protein
MRKKSLMERIRLLGRAAIDIVTVFGRSGIFLVHALFGRGGISGGFQLLVKQLYSVGVMSLAIIVVSARVQHPRQIWLRAGSRSDGRIDAAA